LGRLLHYIFEACSAFPRVTTCRLAESPYATLYIKGSDSFVAFAAASIATGWSEPVPGRDLHPLKSSAFHGALFQQLRGVTRCSRFSESELWQPVSSIRNANRTIPRPCRRIHRAETASRFCENRRTQSPTKSNRFLKVLATNQSNKHERKHQQDVNESAHCVPSNQA
jgi:hypothetical protein